jgi:hypothetical protein
MEDADEIGYKVESEVVGSYKLDDGAKIELRHNVKNIYLLADKKRADGSPIYLVTGEASLQTTRADEGSRPKPGTTA